MRFIMAGLAAALLDHFEDCAQSLGREFMNGYLRGMSLLFLCNCSEGCEQDPGVSIVIRMLNV